MICNRGRRSLSAAVKLVRFASRKTMEKTAAFMGGRREWPTVKEVSDPRKRVRRTYGSQGKRGHFGEKGDCACARTVFCFATAVGRRCHSARRFLYRGLRK